MPRPRTINIKAMSPEEFRAYNREKQRLFYERRKAGIPVRTRQLTGNKNCRKCGERKPFTLEFFAPRGDNHAGLKTICRACMSEHIGLHQATIKYGLTRAQHAMLKARPCVLCGSTKHLRIDHCHKSGRVRNTLCNHCNAGLGFFRDRPDLLRLAAQYVEHYAALHAGTPTPSQS